MYTYGQELMIKNLPSFPQYLDLPLIFEWPLTLLPFTQFHSVEMGMPWPETNLEILGLRLAACILWYSARVSFISTGFHTLSLCPRWVDPHCFLPCVRIATSLSTLYQTAVAFVSNYYIQKTDLCALIAN